MSAGVAADELFLADYANRVVRVFGVRTGPLDARDVYCCPAEENMMNVAYSAKTDTLCVITASEVKKHIVRSFGRTNSEWRECRRLDIDGYDSGERCCVSALSDGRLVFGVMRSSAELRVLAVDDSRAVTISARIRLPAEHVGFDAQLAGGETRLAVALGTGAEAAVALFRVAGDRAEELARCALAGAWRPLFCGDSLLVCGRTANGSSMSGYALGKAGWRLERRCELLTDIGNRWFCWCVVNDALVAWDGQSATLTTYSMLYRTF